MITRHASYYEITTWPLLTQRAGYTVEELFTLSRSINIPQRCLALTVLSKLIRNVRVSTLLLVVMPHLVRKGAVSVGFVHPSVTYVANNSRTLRSNVPKFGMKVPHLWCDSHTSFKVKRSRSPGPLMLTHIVHRIFRTARPTNFKLGIRMDDDDPHQPQAPWPPRSRSQGHVISLSRLGPILYLCH